MKKIAIASLLALLVACGETTSERLCMEVNPFVGTDFTGNTYPGAQAPFGMVQLSPDNGVPGWDYISGYFYPDSTIAGFSHTHLSGTGAGDLYDISYLPVMRPWKEAPAPLGIHSAFSHEREQAHAGYYSVVLDDYDIKVELTASPRCGVQKYTFSRSGDASIILNLTKATNWDATVEQHLDIVDSCTVQGWRFSDGWARNQKVWFVSKFSEPFLGCSADSLYIFDFNVSEGSEVTVSTAISGTGLEGAWKNFSEVDGKSFEAVLAEAEDSWDEALGSIEVSGGREGDRTKFYTALYHVHQAPTLYCDVDGLYLGPDGKTHQADGWQNYSTFSIWDTYRAAHPLYLEICPDRARDMVISMIEFADQNGRLPVWNMWGSETDMMIGYHAASVIAEAYAKGVRGFDAQKALDLCVRTAGMDSYRGIGEYREKGYISSGNVGQENWEVSRTLEYSYDDWCIARLAEMLGRKDTAAVFYERSRNYRNLFNPETGFFQPRLADGRFVEPFNPDEYVESFCESNAWQYLFAVQHDIEGLMELMGGEDRFAQRLEEMFTHSAGEDDELPIFSTGMIGQYVHGNEPSHHDIYLLGKVGRKDLMEKYLRQVMDEFYTNEPGGLCGNEDCGQMSAWYVWTAIGRYPVNPVSGEFEEGIPFFDKVSIRR